MRKPSGRFYTAQVAPTNQLCFSKRPINQIMTNYLPLLPLLSAMLMVLATQSIPVATQVHVAPTIVVCTEPEFPPPVTLPTMPPFIHTKFNPFTIPLSVSALPTLPCLFPLVWRAIPKQNKVARRCTSQTQAVPPVVSTLRKRIQKRVRDVVDDPFEEDAVLASSKCGLQPAFDGDNKPINYYIDKRNTGPRKRKGNTRPRKRKRNTERGRHHYNTGPWRHPLAAKVTIVSATSSRSTIVRHGMRVLQQNGFGRSIFDPDFVSVVKVGRVYLNYKRYAILFYKGRYFKEV